jgi:hypothetical protein
MLKGLAGFLMKPFDALASRIFAVVGAVTLSQFPNFVQAYLQRLGGHLDELKRVIAQYDKAAVSTGKTLKEYISIHMSSNSPEIVKTGQIMNDQLTRVDHLGKSLDVINNAGPFSKFISFCANADFEIARATLKNYTPGLSLNAESILYGLLGMVFGMIIYFILKAPIKGIFDKSLDREKSVF